MSVIPQQTSLKTFPALEKTVQGYYAVTEWRNNNSCSSHLDPKRLNLSLILNDMSRKYFIFNIRVGWRV